MDNDVSCKVVRMGTIRIKTHDSVVRTVKDVRHVPALEQNLISLSTLKSLGYKYTSKGGVLRIVKRSLVVLKAKCAHSLYVLQGSNIVVSACISSIGSLAGLSNDVRQINLVLN